MCVKKSRSDGSAPNTSISTILSEKIISEKTNICYAPLKSDIIEYFILSPDTESFLTRFISSVPPISLNRNFSIVPASTVVCNIDTLSLFGSLIGSCDIYNTSDTFIV